MLNIGTITKSPFAIIAPLEKYGAMLWQDQYTLTQDDVDALNDDRVTESMQYWMVQNQKLQDKVLTEM